jgi:hypothetical protein
MKYLLLLMFFYTNFAHAQNIDNSFGVDVRLDYSSLKEFGPWDDRNYDLVLEDLDWLSENENELIEMVPAFFRVQFRKEFPDTPSTGAVQYPRSLLNYFVLRYVGYLIDGKIYQSAKMDSDYKYFEVEMVNGKSPGELFREQVKILTRALNGEVLVFSGAE